MQKYGNLHFKKINKKFSKCKPALDLLFVSGFKKSEDGKRLIWTHENNSNNILLINHIQNELNSITPNVDTITDFPPIQTSQAKHSQVFYVAWHYHNA